LASGVTPVKTGFQEVVEGLILDSGFRRDDGKKTQTNGFTTAGGQREF
jgi:hypothetical protein